MIKYIYAAGYYFEVNNILLHVEYYKNFIKLSCFYNIRQTNTLKDPEYYNIKFDNEIVTDLLKSEDYDNLLIAKAILENGN